MVKQGFLNLATDEQNRVIEAALEEFANKDYEAASLNNIITMAGISKGSMYHYFAGKEDLYLYLVESVMELKSLFLGQALAEAGHQRSEINFFENLEFQMLTSVDFAVQYYRQHQLGLRLQRMVEGPLKEKLVGDLNRAFEDYLKEMVDHAIEKGEIRDDFDKNFVIRILKFTLMRFTEIYPDYSEFTTADSNVLKEEIRKLSLFLRKGLQKRGTEVEV